MHFAFKGIGMKREGESEECHTSNSNGMKHKSVVKVERNIKHKAILGTVRGFT